ncbi:transketolase family protein [Patescibacteria group bacterium]
MRDGYGTGVVKVGKRNEDVVVLCADLTESTRSMAFKQEYPERFFEVGVAEQNMAGIAAGLALSGKIPFISSYAVFSPGRNWDQIRISICYSGANVTVIGAHAGISVGPDGATHQALEDIAIMRVLPRMTVICPVDAIETEKAVIASTKIKGPVYIRFGRDPVPIVTTKQTPFKIGKAEVYKEGTDVSIIACGTLVFEALVAAKKLGKRNIKAQVINNHTVKPLDSKTIIQAAKKTGAVVTAEQHQVNGGMGSAVIELLAEKIPVPVERVGVKDTFGESGKPSELMKKYGLTSEHIIQAVLKVVKRK